MSAKTTKSVDPGALSLPEMHNYLLNAVAPRPIAFVSTVDPEGNGNLSPFSYFNVFSVNPPILIFSSSRRGRDNTIKHTHENLLQVPEAVINIVNYPMVEQMSLASTEYPTGTNEFVKAGFTQVPSVKVKPPRVGESPVAFECEVKDVVAMGEEGGAGNLFVAHVVMVHLQTQYLNAEGKLDSSMLDLVGRMGGNWYTRANGDALFEIPKPLQKKGIGIDQLPESIRTSTVLTGNNLGRLGNVEALPSTEEILNIKSTDTVMKIMQQNVGRPQNQRIALHRHARVLLDAGDTDTALKVLLLPEVL